MYFVLLMAILLLFALAWIARKLMLDWTGDGEESNTPGFTLADLRRLHEDGQLTDQEFERAKLQLVQTLQMAQSRPKDTPAKTREGPAPPPGNPPVA